MFNLKNQYSMHLIEWLIKRLYKIIYLNNPLYE
jgi:hypothetical protein